MTIRLFQKQAVPHLSVCPTLCRCNSIAIIELLCVTEPMSSGISTELSLVLHAVCRLRRFAPNVTWSSFQTRRSHECRRSTFGGKIRWRSCALQMRLPDVLPSAQSVDALVRRRWSDLKCRTTHWSARVIHEYISNVIVLKQCIMNEATASTANFLNLQESSFFGAGHLQKCHIYTPQFSTLHTTPLNRIRLTCLWPVLTYDELLTRSGQLNSHRILTVESLVSPSLLDSV
jgi:hypothetical protein